MTKRLLSILLILVSAQTLCAGLHSYADHSILQSGTFIKVRVSESGVYSIPYDSLTKWGLNPDKVCVLGYGGNMLSENFQQDHYDDLPSVAFYMYKGADNIFNSGDYILFYAQGPVSWQYASGRWRHTRNPYSNYGYYFISDTEGKQKQMPTATLLTDAAYNVSQYTHYQLHELDTINLIDITGIAGGGRDFYGENFSTQTKKRTFTFPCANVLTNQNTSLFASVAAYSSQNSTFTVSFGAAEASAILPAVPTSDFYTKATVDSIIINTNATSTGDQQVTLTYTNSLAGAAGYLDYIEMAVPCALTMNGDAMLITNTENVGQPGNTRFTLSNANTSTLIWRIADGVNIEMMPTTIAADQLTWIVSNDNIETFVAINPTASFRKPKTMGKIANQDLHRLSNIDYVIICPEDFVAAATRLAQKHEQTDNMTWAVVTDQQVYNEFSSGTPDVTAYRWLMKMLWDRANGNTTQQPKNLLLFGSASYDNRRILPNVSGISKLLVYESHNSINEVHAYANDDYCSFMADNAGIDSRGNFSDARAQMAFGVGRITATDVDAAGKTVDKICTYMDNARLGKWKTQLCFLADDGDHGLHVQTADGGAERIRKKNPYFVINKIYLDAYTQEVNAAGESYPLAKNQFDNLLQNGVLFMDYSGHGGYNNITSEQILTSKDIQQMTNVNQGLWLLATCSFAHFDGQHVCAAEEAVLNPYGGAIGVISACRTVYASQNTILNRNICDTLFGHKDVFHYDMTIGQALRMGKNITGNDANKMAYVLLGDPALRLNYPTDYQVKTTTHIDTLRALTVQSIEGYIQSPDLDTATWFNGKLSVTIYDKMQQITTRDNDETEEESKIKVTYNDYQNILFSGNTTVTDGKFSFEFMVPKDIRYNYGPGHIVYYVQDTLLYEEGTGHYDDFIIGGSSSLVIVDTIGPEITPYLNTPSFPNGGQTYEFPHFYAKISDEHGINTMGAGIGHDLLLTIDSSNTLIYTLNDYYESTNNSYQQGLVSYKLPEMTEGTHNLTFRAWDLLNNSSTVSLTFEVIKGLDPNIYSVTNYPSPLASTDIMNISINHDQPDEYTETTVYLYNMCGQLLVEQKENNVTNMQINLGDYNICPGVYIYQIKMKTTTSQFVTKSGKVVVNR